ncbi:YaiI/YqxD family protein [Jeotgalibacillus aurantiacus]|uniref:YaiI/YqxD family protein n=1 Tax=Jeotgalibacillus aurantiacus TaxID=2763266 RepID=UPI001D0B8C4D|nr:DUF188 domain-containing protein [Jeotgalibacillus aurantiacus]
MNECKSGFTVYVDADACPSVIKEEIVRLMEGSAGICRFIASYRHFSPEADRSLWTFIDDGKEAADLYIANRVREGDIVVTQDIGLASLVLSKGVYALSPRGKEYKPDKIDTSLSFRYLHQMERKKGNYSPGPKKLTMIEVETFSKTLLKFLFELEGKA